MKLRSVRGALPFAALALLSCSQVAKMRGEVEGLGKLGRASCRERV